MQRAAYRLHGVGRVPLWRRNRSIAGWATVDLEDLPLVRGSRWYRNGAYAVRSIQVPGVGKRGEYMHLVVLGIEYGASKRSGIRVEADHKDRNGLNNRRSNLRVVTRAQNMQNRSKSAGTTSRFRGVYWHKRAAKWSARGKKQGRMVYLGLFESEEDAARVAAEFRREHHPYSID